MLRHQKLALSWMCRRERSRKVRRQRLPTALVVIAPPGAVPFTPATRPPSPVPHPTPQVSGGILADDQGLGKTVTTIALILSHPPGGEYLHAPPSGSGDEEEEEEEGAQRGARRRLRRLAGGGHGGSSGIAASAGASAGVSSDVSVRAAEHWRG
jgi:hypothetical protein